MVHFRLSPQKRQLLLRRNLSLVGLGLVLFVGSLVAMRIRPRSWLFGLGAAGALFLVVGVRRLFLGARPLSVGQKNVWFGTRGISLHQVESLEVAGDRLLVRYGGGKQIEESLEEPAQAAAEIARAAGLRPPRKESSRWERRSGGEEKPE